MRLHEKYRPDEISELVGDRTMRSRLREFCDNPHPRCIALIGDTGTGKTTAAYAIAKAVGVYDDPMFGVFGPVLVEGPELTVDRARELFGQHDSKLRLRRDGFHVVVIEELETLHPKAVQYLKGALERAVRDWKVVVIVTSNDFSKLETAFQHRFKPRFRFEGNENFAAVCQVRLRKIWQQEMTTPLPDGWEKWGYQEDGKFSMRDALDSMEDAIEASWSGRRENTERN